MVSRVLGLVREIFIAAFLSTSIFADAFYVALRLPNMFRRIFGEGAFNSAFVPLFNRELVETSSEEAERFASNAFSWLGGVLLAGTLVIIPGMPWFARILAPAAEPETYGWIVFYGQIMFSYLLCMALSAHLSGVLNSLRVFSMPAFAPVLLNVFMLVVLAVLVPLAHWRGERDMIGTALSWSVCLAGFAQLLLLWITCWRKGMRIRVIRPFRSDKIRRLVTLMGPGVISAGIYQLNVIISTMIASSKTGAPSSLNYVDRLIQLPHGLIGAAFGVVLLPEVTRLLRSGDEKAANNQVGEAIVFSMLLTVPAALAFAAVPADFVRTLYERVDFTAEQTARLAPALALYALGLPAYVLVKVLQTAYFSRENTMSPMKIAGVALVVNAILCLALFPRLGINGIAIGSTASGWTYVAMLVAGLKGHLGITRHRLHQLARILVAAVLMGGALLLTSRFLAPWLDGSEWQRVLSLGGLIVAGGAAYAFLALALRATSLHELKAGFRK